MAKKKAAVRKLGGAAGITTIGDVEPAGVDDFEDGPAAATLDDVQDVEANGKAAKPPRKAKARSESPSDAGFGVSEIRKAAGFANSVGGLDKAMTLLQILKVAKEVQ